MSILSSFRGTVVKDSEYGPNGIGLISPMQILTPNGAIDVDLTDSWYPDIKVGDLIECEEGRGYFLNGRLMSYEDEEITINGVVYKEPE